MVYEDLDLPFEGNRPVVLGDLVTSDLERHPAQWMELAHGTPPVHNTTLHKSWWHLRIHRYTAEYVDCFSKYVYLIMYCIVFSWHVQKMGVATEMAA